MSRPSSEKKSRLITLDYLRGFFIVVIILDHLSRWPSIWSAITGKALLWVTAAEGFVAISGLLVGYVRGYKNKAESMRDVSLKLWKRAGLLYVWSIITSIAYTAFMWYVPLVGGAPTMKIPAGHWSELIIHTLTLQYTHLWVHFLTLYALFLAVAPLAVWLLRRGQAWIVIVLSFAALCLGWLLKNEPLQWQFLFFIPAVAGYYLHSILDWWRGLSRRLRFTITALSLSLTGLSITLSALCTFSPDTLPTITATLNPLFAKDTISLWRAGMAFTWFVGFILLFNLARPLIDRLFGWLLLPFGTRSLTAYILHGVAICLISYLTLSSADPVANTILGAACLLLVWGLMKIPFVSKIIPA